MIRFKNKNRTDDEYVKITVQSDNSKELEISMMGSGFLQVAEIFSTIEYIENQAGGICLILIDEPDSHIHSDLQAHLIDELKNHQDSQIFVITHNDRLISKVEEGELYFLNNSVKEMGKLDPLQIKDFHKIKEALAGILNELQSEDSRPIILTEGKTDQKILNTAWDKLYPNKEMPYQVISSGIQIDEESRTGSAEAVRRSLEYLSTITDRKIIGLFDNDREGNEQFKWLNKDIFEPHDLTKGQRKHLAKEIFGMLLTPPRNRELFVTQKSLKQRYLVMEHYFPDDILEKNKMKDEPILGTNVYEISGKNKSEFSNNSINFDIKEFESFRPLFEEFNKLLAIT